MAEREELIIEISAETVELVRALATAENLLEDFGDEGTITAKKLSDALEAVKSDFDSVKDSIPTDKIKQYEVAINELTTSLGKVDGGTKKTESSLGKVDEASRRARIAVYGLNQVVRDLPFGFIAISNNLPVLIDQFQQLRAESKNGFEAFKAFARGLIGAGGVSIALSAVISLITSAVQQYGSLKAAIQGIFGTLSQAEKLQLAFNKAMVDGASSMQVALTNLDLLSSLSNNAALSTENAAYASGLLKQEIDKLILSQDLSKDATVGVTGELLDYAKGIIVARAVTQGFQKVIADLGTQYAKTALEGVTFTDYLVAGYTKVKTFIDLIAAGQWKDAISFAKVDFGEIALKRYRDRLKEIEDQIKKANAAQEQYIVDQTNNGFKLIDIIGKTLDAETKKDKENAKNAKEAAALAAKLAKEKEDINLQILQSELQTLKDRLAATNKFSTEYLDIVRSIANKEYEIELAKAVKIANTRDEYNRLALEAKKRFDIAMSQAVPQMQTATNIPLPGIGEIPKKIDPTVSSGYNQLVSAIKAANIAQEEFLKLNNQVATKLSDIAASFTTTLLNGALEGKNAIELLTDSVKQLVVQLAAAVVKALVFKTITAALNTAAPGSGTLVQGIASALQGSFGSFLGRSAANVGQGGLALAGQVVFVQRGPDLVGVLNNTNSRIGRVG